MTPSVPKKHFYHALCICKGDDDDLELLKAYAVFPGADNEAGFLRVVDESGEYYLYPAEQFTRLELPLGVETTHVEMKD